MKVPLSYRTLPYYRLSSCFSCTRSLRTLSKCPQKRWARSLGSFVKAVKHIAPQIAGWFESFPKTVFLWIFGRDRDPGLANGISHFGFQLSPIRSFEYDHFFFSTPSVCKSKWLLILPSMILCIVIPQLSMEQAFSMRGLSMFTLSKLLPLLSFWIVVCFWRFPSPGICVLLNSFFGKG